jgi:hypothetical protein
MLGEFIAGLVAGFAVLFLFKIFKKIIPSKKVAKQ